MPDLNEAVKFFTEVLGFHQVYEEGKLPLNADAKKAFNIRRSAEITHIALLETGNGSNIELFEYTSPQRNMKRPMNDDIDWYHIAVYISNMQKSVSYLKAKGIRIIGVPIEHKTGPNAGLTGVYFETPRGLQIELVTYPQGMAYEQSHPKYKLWSPKNELTIMKSNEELAAEAKILVMTHLNIWTERDPAKRLQLTKDIYAENIKVIDPEIVLNGWNEVSDFIGGLLHKYPGFEFSPVKAIETHHDSAILSWQFGPPSKLDTITGLDIFAIANGKIIKLIVFVNGATKQNS